MDSKSRWAKLKHALLNTKPPSSPKIKHKQYVLEQGIRIKLEWEEKQVTREELLTACQQEVDHTDKRVCELGAGKSGLAAIALAVKLKDRIGEIMISDGNEQCWDSIRSTLELNKDQIGPDNMARITVKCIVWDENLQLSENKYDYICIADCLFFRKYHKALEHTLSELLEDSDEEGRVFIMGPNRSNTMWEFIDNVENDNIFEHTVEEMEGDPAIIEDILSPTENEPGEDEEKKEIKLKINTNNREIESDSSGSSDDSEGEVNLPEIDNDGSDKYIPTLMTDSDKALPTLEEDSPETD